MKAKKTRATKRTAAKPKTARKAPPKQAARRAATGMPAKKSAAAPGKRRAPKPRRPAVASAVLATPVPTLSPAERLRDLAVAALEDVKGVAIAVLDVRGASAVTDFIVIASGTSDRHVKSLAASVQRSAKLAGHRALGTEGELAGEWVLVDLRDVVVHVMLARARAFYQLEKLWGMDAPVAQRGA